MYASNTLIVSMQLLRVPRLLEMQRLREVRFCSLLQQVMDFTRIQQDTTFVNEPRMSDRSRIWQSQLCDL